MLLRANIRGFYPLFRNADLTTSSKMFCTSGGPIKIEDVDGVRRITLADSKTRNSLSQNTVSLMRKAVTEKLDDSKLRVIVFCAEGNVFSAGHNLKELRSESGANVFSEFSKLMMAIINAPVPVIATVDGLAAAAGCQLVAQSDILLCTERSTFSTPGASFGVFCSTPGVAVARAVPLKIASYMLFTGLPINSHQALQYGLVHQVSKDKDELEVHLKTVVDAIKSKSRAVVELGKKNFYKQIQVDLPRAYELSTKTMVENLELPDGQEGLASFVEKRKPIWKN